LLPLPGSDVTSTSTGKGCVFTYDAIGSYERTNYSCQGSGQALIMPVLDNQLKAVSPLLHPPRSSATPLSEAEALDLVKDCFASAGARLRAGFCLFVCCFVRCSN
jgi:20S proteasome subunit beta 6